VVFGNAAKLHSEEIVSFRAASDKDLLLIVALQRKINSTPIFGNLPGVEVGRGLEDLHRVSRHVEVDAGELAAVDDHLAVEEGAGVKLADGLQPGLGKSGVHLH
jgi:hypothetical protein